MTKMITVVRVAIIAIVVVLLAPLFLIAISLLGFITALKCGDSFKEAMCYGGMAFAFANSFVVDILKGLVHWIKYGKYKILTNEELDERFEEYMRV